MDELLDSITIRTMSKKDIPAVYDMMLETFVKNPAYPSHSDFQSGVVVNQPLSDSNKEYLLTHCKNHVSKRNYIGIVAVDKKDKIAGVILLQKHKSVGSTPWGEVSDVILAPKQRSDGLGQVLLARATAMFRKWGCDSAYLETGVNNKKAHRFFIGQGWQVVSHVLKLNTKLPQLPTTEIEVPTADPSQSNIPPTSSI